jgi:hypothetical protein
MAFSFFPSYLEAKRWVTTLVTSCAGWHYKESTTPHNCIFALLGMGKICGAAAPWRKVCLWDVLIWMVVEPRRTRHPKGAVQR